MATLTPLAIFATVLHSAFYLRNDGYAIQGCASKNICKKKKTSATLPPQSNNLFGSVEDFFLTRQSTPTSPPPLPSPFLSPLDIFSLPQHCPWLFMPFHVTQRRLGHFEWKTEQENSIRIFPIVFRIWIQNIFITFDGLSPGIVRFSQELSPWSKPIVCQCKNEEMKNIYGTVREEAREMWMCRRC